jgi:hypothetical protein
LGNEEINKSRYNSALTTIRPIKKIMSAKKSQPNFPPLDKIDLYEKLVAAIPGIKSKGATMPYTSLNGNMFSFLDKKSGSCGIRLPEKGREDFVKKYKTKLFKAYGMF